MRGGNLKLHFSLFLQVFVSSFSSLLCFFRSPCFFICLFPRFLVVLSCLLSSFLPVSSFLCFLLSFFLRSSFLHVSLFLQVFVSPSASFLRFFVPHSFFISSSPRLFVTSFLHLFVSSFPHFLYFFGSSCPPFLATFFVHFFVLLFLHFSCVLQLNTNIFLILFIHCFDPLIKYLLIPIPSFL